jgi:hypothetical protein
MAYREHEIRRARITVPLTVGTYLSLLIWLGGCALIAFQSRDVGTILVMMLFALLAPAFVFLRARAFELEDDNGKIHIRRLGVRGWQPLLSAPREDIVGVELEHGDGTERIVLRMRDGRTQPLESTLSSDSGRSAAVEKMRAFLR